MPNTRSVAVGIEHVEVAHAIGAIGRGNDYPRSPRHQFGVERVDVVDENAERALPGRAFGEF